MLLIKTIQRLGRNEKNNELCFNLADQRDETLLFLKHARGVAGNKNENQQQFAVGARCRKSTGPWGYYIEAFFMWVLTINYFVVTVFDSGTKTAGYNSTIGATTILPGRYKFCSLLGTHLSVCNTIAGLNHLSIRVCIIHMSVLDPTSRTESLQQERKFLELS